MPEADRLLFDLRELAEVLVKSQNIHEGHWGIYVEFGLAAANLPSGPGEITPAAINLVQKVGIQRFGSPNNLTVDAGKLGASPTTGEPKPTPKKGATTKASKKGDKR